MVLVEARVLRGDDRVLQMGRDLAERKEGITFLIRFVMHPGLYAALYMHRGGRRVNPARCYQRQRGQQPKKRRIEDEPSKTRSENMLPKRRLGGDGWRCGHISG